MRLVVISTPVFPVGPAGAVGYSGLEHIAWLQAKLLAARGHQVVLIAPDGSNCPGVQVLHTGPAGHHSEEHAYGGHKIGREHAGYWQALRDFKPDAVLDHSWQKMSVLAKQEGWLKCPVLAWCHAPIDTMFRELPAPGLLQFVCISEDQRRHFEGLFNRSARTCYNGVDPEFYRPLGIPRTDRFLFLARFSKVKSPELAIEACQRAGVGLDLVGDTQLTGEPEFLQSILNKADGKQIRFVGPATRGETVYWFSQAHALIHPVHQFREPFGLAPVESQLCGCPVIAWNNGAMRETVEHGRTGYLVQSVEELCRAVGCEKEDDVFSTMRNDCREWAMQFSAVRMAARCEELCFEAIEKEWS